MNSENNQAPSIEQYILVALIDICRGIKVNVPVGLDKQKQNDVIKDVLSSAISFTEKQESMPILSEELFKCSREGLTLADQMEIIQRQSPDVINAKTVAAAYLLKILNKENNI